jgi:hypothetical protein
MRKSARVDGSVVSFGPPRDDVVDRLRTTVSKTGSGRAKTRLNICAISALPHRLDPRHTYAKTRGQPAIEKAWRRSHA